MDEPRPSDYEQDTRTHSAGAVVSAAAEPPTKEDDDCEKSSIFFGWELFDPKSSNYFDWDELDRNISVPNAVSDDNDQGDDEGNRSRNSIRDRDVTI